MISIPRGIVLGLVGPPGVGKGYVTQAIRASAGEDEIGFICRVTNRDVRESDPLEGVLSGLDDSFFSDPENHIVATHRPFNDHRKYGWILNGVHNGLEEGRSYIFDPNVDYLRLFRDELTPNLRLVGMVADEHYIRGNLEGRANGDLKALSEIERRIEVGKEYAEKVLEFNRDGLVDSVVTLTMENRERTTEMVCEEVWKLNTSVEGVRFGRERR